MKRPILGMADWVLDKSRKFYAQGDWARIVRVPGQRIGKFGGSWEFKTGGAGGWLTQGTYRTLLAAKKAALDWSTFQITEPTNEDRSRIARGKITQAASLLKEARDLLRAYLPDDHGAVHQSGLAYDRALVAESWCKIESQTYADVDK